HIEEYTDEPYGSQYFLPSDKYSIAARTGYGWKQEYEGGGNSVRNLVIDCNIENQQGMFSANSAFGSGGYFSLHRNSPIYSGIVGGNHGYAGGSVPLQDLHTENVAVVGCPATPFVTANTGSGGGTFTAEGWMMGGDTDINHTFYLQGITRADSVSFHEDTWGNEVYGFEADYLVVERAGTQGLRHGQGVGGGYALNNRGSDSWDCDVESGARANCGMKVRSFFLDLRDATGIRGG